jgi:hypothetical protein
MKPLPPPNCVSPENERRVVWSVQKRRIVYRRLELSESAQKM